MPTAFNFSSRREEHLETNLGFFRARPEVKFNLEETLMYHTNAGSPSLDFEPSRTVAVSRQSNNLSVGKLAVGGGNQADMELESEGPLATAMQALDLDSTVRAEANLGFQQVRSIEQQLRTAPQGFLGRADSSDAQALRTTILSASVTILGSFSKIIGLLSTSGATSFRNDNFSTSNRIGRGDSPLSSSHTYDTPPQSPLPPAAAGASKVPVMINPVSPVTSPVTTPHSGSGSDDSPNPASSPSLLDSDGEAVAAAVTTNVPGGAGRARRASNEASISGDTEVAKQKSLSVKRKFLPKITVKQQASGTDPGNDGPSDDGYTWRKYGQKDILGSRNPRSYYRCTHKNEMGCQAIKYVQRCDEEPLLFEVTYKGHHSCQSIQQQYPAWQFSYSPEQVMAMTRAHQLSPSDSSAMVNFPASLEGGHLAPPSSASQQSHEILLAGSSSSSSSRPSFSDLIGGLPMGGVVPSTSTILDVPSAGPSRFGLNPNPSMELGVHQHNFSAKPDDGNSSQQTVFDVSRLPRDTYDRSLYQMLMANVRTPGQNDLSSTLMDEDPPSLGDLKRTRLQHDLLMEQARSTVSETNSGQVDKSTQLQYTHFRWGAELDSDLQLDGQVSQRYDSNSSVISDNSRELLGNQTTSAEGGRITSIKESDDSEETRVSLAMGPIGFLDDMDYDGSSFHSSNTYF